MPDHPPSSRREFIKEITAASVILSAVPFALVPETHAADQAPQWLNPPKRWKVEGKSLICTADPKTDFWRKTFYGYVTDNGHFYYRRMTGDFTTYVKFTGQYHDLYDQAGLMVRIDAEHWMKCGVEFVEGRRNMSIVYTREYSSWATGRLPDSFDTLWLRVVRKGPALDIFYSLDGLHFVETGVGYLGTAETVMVGPMCAAPEGKGFEVQFDDWTLQPV
jgi:regulation of enolase protein 1 (concanavalin A-like superfamily)